MIHKRQCELNSRRIINVQGIKGINTNVNREYGDFHVLIGLEVCVIKV